jgi:hypothetical protein
VEWHHAPRHILRPLDLIDDVPTMLELYHERLIELAPPPDLIIELDPTPPAPVYDEPPF